MNITTKRTEQWVIVFTCLVVLFASLPAMVLGQPYISTKGGLINVIEGQAEVHNARDMRWEKAKPLLQMRQGDELRIHENSRVEMLLNPGSFARLGPESTVRLVNDRLTALSLELLSGSMEVEAGNIKSIRQIAVSVSGQGFNIVKDGVYRFDINDSGTATARVFRGEMVTVAANGKTSRMKKSSSATFGSVDTKEAFNHFDTKQIDNLSEWGVFRSEQLAQSNLGVIRSFSQGYYPGGLFGYSGFGPYRWSCGWYYDPFYTFYTYMPCQNNFFSPYGGFFFSPIVVVTNAGRGVGTNRGESLSRSHDSIGPSPGSGLGRGSAPSSGSSPMSAPSGGSMRSEGGRQSAPARH
ncbi:MAG: hypothetical protein WBN92_00205 [Terriglobia bacterium]